MKHKKLRYIIAELPPLLMVVGLSGIVLSFQETPNPIFVVITCITGISIGIFAVIFLIKDYKKSQVEDKLPEE